MVVELAELGVLATIEDGEEEEEEEMVVEKAFEETKELVDEEMIDDWGVTVVLTGLVETVELAELIELIELAGLVELVEPI